MDQAGLDLLRGRRVLLVEDDYFIASDLARTLEDLDMTVVGPAGSVSDALALIGATAELDAAVLDINLGTEKAYPIADALQSRGVPVVFATGYDEWIIPEHYADVPRCQKPVDLDALETLLVSSLDRP